jgi:hypothetical protein
MAPNADQNTEDWGEAPGATDSPLEDWGETIPVAEPQTERIPRE